jgi:hypothetical protein
MAKAASITSVYEIRSARSAESIFVTERAIFKLDKVGANKVTRTGITPSARDKAGREFERLQGMRFRCVATGEMFNIIEQAPSIRKESV